MKITIVGTALILLISLSSYKEIYPVLKSLNSDKMSNREKVVSLLKSIETGEKEPVGFINPNKYIQHNLNAADGLAGFGALMKS
ncbi:MAG: hypothetical protein WAM46_20405 [Flavobacterium sp.]